MGASVEAWRALRLKEWARALALCESALEKEPADVEARRALALSLWGHGRTSEAREALELAARSGWVDAELWSDLGALRYGSREWVGASEAFEASLRLEPGGSTSLHGLAESLLRLHRYAEAARAFESCLALWPDRRPLRLSLAHCLAEEGRLDDAAELVERCPATEPACERSLLLLANIRHRQLRPELVRELTQAAVRANPESFAARAKLALACWGVGDVLEAVARRDEALRLPATDRDLHSNLAWLSLHDPSASALELLDIHRRTATAWASRVAPAGGHCNVPDPDRRLRVGYLSGEFTRGPAYCFLASWMKRQDREQVESFYYMSRPGHDWHTEQFAGMADHWRDVAAMYDDAIVSQVRRDEIDILVDVSGHFDCNRLGVFVARPAPVQVTFPNYPGTTGVAAIDYIFTDVWTTPEGTESEYAERPYRLASGYLMYDPAVDLPPVSSLPARGNGQVTFGLFQRPGKYNAGFWDAVAEVLRRVPDSRLLVHFESAELDEEGSSQRERLMAPLIACGVDAGRIAFCGSRNLARHMEIVSEVDIALDSFPYNGQTTTCDCLYMGVPVVSLYGASHVARVGSGLLIRAGLGHLVAHCVADYVRIATELALDFAALSELRSGLRLRVAPLLGDGLTLSREIEAAYRSMWRTWCARTS